MCVNDNAFLSAVTQFLFVEFHVDDVLVLILRLQQLILTLVVIVDEVDVLKEVFEYGLRTHDRLFNQQGATEVLARLHQVVGAEMVLGEGSLVITAEGALHRVDARVVFVIVKQRHTGCGLFGLLVPKARVGVNEEGVDRRQNEREQSRVLRGVGHMAAVHENVFAARVSMEITKDS